MKLIICTVALVFFICTNGSAQEQRLLGQDDYVASVIRSLNESNVLRMALERGERGDGVHSQWMDGMRSFNIKQAAYAFRFHWDGRAVSEISVKKATYGREYYEPASTIKVKTELEQIERSGLGSTLEAEAKKAAVSFLFKILRIGQRASGTVYVSLLDDERLPPMNDLPSIDYP